MFGNLFGAKTPSARVPEGARLYAVGDIHGCADLLDALLAKIAENETAGPADGRLVFLGDYIDRGPDSRGVIDRLLAIREQRPDTIFLKGNHEAAMLDFLADPAAGSPWLDWGGEQTLTSYGVAEIDRRDPAELADELKSRLPPEHLRFVNTLSLIETIGDYCFVHAGVKPGRPFDAQEEEDLLWIRGEFHNAPARLRPDKVIVHGHHPMKKPLDAGWRIAVDTGACFTGRLTAVILEGDLRRFLST